MRQRRRVSPLMLALLVAAGCAPHGPEALDVRSEVASHYSSLGALAGADEYTLASATVLELKPDPARKGVWQALVDARGSRQPMYGGDPEPRPFHDTLRVVLRPVGGGGWASEVAPLHPPE
ncbi:MAG TPA: hypothetical protein VFQ39_09025 [Longimicrobium sp.]|nr:hypothetical protein [Longimicrobium sp.]